MISPLFLIEFDRRHILNSARYKRNIDKLYQDAIKEFVQLAKGLKIDPNRPFSLSDYPKTRGGARKILQGFVSGTTRSIRNSEEAEWLLANEKNDALVSKIFKGSKLSKADISRYQNRNLKALAAFTNRKEGGLGLSDRVWKYSNQFKDEIEMGLDIGLGEGKSAAKMATDMKQYLQHPDKLFRRIRNKHGNLVLSRHAANFHPGQGVYRSSYKNSLRLTRTNTNLSYRQSDHARWSKMDFVRGIEVKTSHSHKVTDICDELAGKYPKGFNFTGWHPLCYCFAVPLLADDDEFEQMQMAILNGEDPAGISMGQEVKGLPSNFTKWVKENKDKIERAKSKPYFIRDNAGMLKKAIKANTTRDVIKYIPGRIGDYEAELGVKVDRSVFDLLNDPVKLRITHRGGAYFRPDQKDVTISINERRLASKWNAEAVVYHEFGHAIDFQRNIRNMPEVTGLMAKYRKKLAADNNAGYKSTDDALWKEGEDAYNAGKRDLANQTGAAHDTLAALNPQFGAGHQKSYWRTIPEADKLEFVAHMFENYFIGNPVFEKHLPKLYADMRAAMMEIVDQIKQK